MFRSHGPFGPRRALLCCLTLALLFAATGAEAQLQIGQQVAAPAYYWPGDAAATTTDWTALNATGPLASSPGVTTIAIANVNNGPDYAAFPLTGNNYSPNWANVISAAHANGIKVLGYVDTGYFGTTSPAHRTRLRATDVESWRSQIEHDIVAAPGAHVVGAEIEVAVCPEGCAAIHEVADVIDHRRGPGCGNFE